MVFACFSSSAEGLHRYINVACFFVTYRYIPKHDFAERDFILRATFKINHFEFKNLALHRERIGANYHRHGVVWWLVLRNALLAYEFAVGFGIDASPATFNNSEAHYSVWFLQLSFNQPKIFSGSIAGHDNGTVFEKVTDTGKFLKTRQQ